METQARAEEGTQPAQHENPVKKFARSLHLRVVFPIVAGIGLLVMLLVLSGFQEALKLITSFRPLFLVYFFLTALVYEVARCIEWHYLLERLGFRLPWNSQIFSYGIGELTKNLPVGNFVPDYVLQRSKGADFGRSSSATLLITLLEVGVSLAGIVIIGIDGWKWLRPLILIGCFVFALAVWAFYRWHRASEALEPTHPHHPSQSPAWMTRPLSWRWVIKSMKELRQFVEGEATLLHPHIVATAAGYACVYLFFNGLGLYIVITGLGLSGVTWYEAISASLFSLAFSMIVPLPMDLGTTEVSGTGALLAMGLSAPEAVSAMLLFRFLMLVVQVLVTLLVIVLYPDEMRATVRKPAQNVSR